MEPNQLRGPVGRAAPVSLFIISVRTSTKRPTDRYRSTAWALGTTGLDHVSLNNPQSFKSDHLDFGLLLFGSAGNSLYGTEVIVNISFLSFVNL